MVCGVGNTNKEANEMVSKSDNSPIFGASLDRKVSWIYLIYCACQARCYFMILNESLKNLRVLNDNLFICQ